MTMVSTPSRWAQLRQPAATRRGELAARPWITQPLWRRMLRNRRVLLGVIVIAALYVVAILAPLLAPADPNAQVLIERLKPPSWDHPLGTDSLGRDILSRAIWATRVSLSVSLVAMLITIGLGAVVGLTAGFLGGGIDTLLMRTTDVFLAFPIFILLITIVSIYGSSVTLLILFMGLTAWPLTARTVRAEVLSLKKRDFVEAARVSGATVPWILARHLLPNVAPVIVVAATLRVASVILIEAGLSYFGLGVPPPRATWGNMVADGRLFLDTAWWITTMPGILVVITVLSYNLLGEGLRDQLDPRRWRR
jgi:peptide/nickel transport system permease protein